MAERGAALASNARAEPDVEGSSQAYGWYVVAVLILAYTVSYVDRQILTLLVGPIKASLHVSDLQVSLLHGLAFAIFYTVLGIPIARLADRYRRTTIMSGGIAVWSVMTALCALAKSFSQLFVARIGVGVGEAALGPAAFSMIADYFPPNKLAKALSLYTGAIYFGAGLAIIAGGALIAHAHAVTLPWVGHLEPWRLVFLIVGAPGLLVAILTSTLREPARTGIKPGKDAIPNLAQVARYIGDRRAAYLLLILGYSGSSLMWNGVSAWIPTHFIRTFGWRPGEIGLRYGLALMVFGSAGLFLGITLASRLRRRGHGDANLLVGVVSAALAIPGGVLAPLMAAPAGSAAVYCLFILASAMPYGCAAAALQEITPNRMRAQVTALYFFGINLAGIGLGPTVVALFTDRVFHNELMLRDSLALTTLIGATVCIVLLSLARRPYRKALSLTPVEAGHS